MKDIAEKGADYFYDSSFTDNMISELQEHGSILTRDDFTNYEAIEREVTRSEYKGYKVFGVSSPAGGPVLGLILNIMNGMFHAVIRCWSAYSLPACMCQLFFISTSVCENNRKLMATY